MKICYIVGAGDFAYPFIPKDDELVIAADGGYDVLRFHGIRCDCLIGDLDSVKSTLGDVKIIRHKKEKDETDMHLALMHGASLGYTEFRIYGATGGRQDHTFANYCLLLWAKNRGYNAKIVSEGMLVSLIKDESVTLYGKAGSVFSLFAFGSDALGVCVKGAKYELSDAALSCEFALGISNEFSCESVSVGVKDGALLVMQKF